MKNKDKKVKRYIDVNGKPYRYIGSYDKLGFEKVNEKFEKLKKVAVYYCGEVFPYYGDYDATEKHKSGLYYQKNGKSIKMIKSLYDPLKYTKEDVYEVEVESEENNSNTLTLDASLVDEIKEIKTDAKINEKRKAIKKSSIQRANDYLKFEINEEDDIMVRLIKERINDSFITMNDVYEKYENEGYNLYYGLLRRNTITLKSLEKWCNITNSEFEFIIKAKDEKKK